MSVSSIDSVWVYVEDMDRAAKFYSDVLGLSKGYASPYWSDFHLGEARIGLHASHGESRASNWMLCIRTENLKQLATRIRASGVKVIGFHETPTGVLLEFKDTEGNTLQVIEKGAKLAEIES